MAQYVPLQKLIVIYDDGQADLTDIESWQIVKPNNSRALGAGIELHKVKNETNPMIQIWICFNEDLTINTINNEQTINDQKTQGKIVSCYIYSNWDQFIERLLAIEHDLHQSLHQSSAVLPFEKPQIVMSCNLRMP